MKKTLYLHIGQSKTGTTFLQNYLFHNRRALGVQGILYPRTGCTAVAGHYRLMRSINGYVKAGDSEPDRELWTPLEQEIRDGPHPKVLVCSEYLEQLNAQQLGRLSGLLQPHTVHIIVYLRRQDERLQSLYKQRLESGDPVPESVSGFYESTYFDPFRPTMDHHAFLATWAAVFGWDALHIRIYEKQQLPQGLANDFLGVFGLSESDGFKAPEASVPNFNLKAATLEFKRLANYIPFHSQVHAHLKDYLHEMDALSGGYTVFAGHNAMSPAERIALLERYAASNTRVAREVLHREDGVLFRDPPPDPSAPWEPYPGLSIPELARIAAGLFAFQETELVKQKKAIVRHKQEIAALEERLAALEAALRSQT